MVVLDRKSNSEEEEQADSGYLDGGGGGETVDATRVEADARHGEEVCEHIFGCWRWVLRLTVVEDTETLVFRRKIISLPLHGEANLHPFSLSLAS